MLLNRIFCLTVTVLLLGSAQLSAAEKDKLSDSLVIQRDTATWFDKGRNRSIPVALYSTHIPVKRRAKQPLVILNPGYPGRNTDYSFIANKLAALGYFVVTIQHNLPTDQPMPTQGNIYQLRLPFWNTGVANILFVTERLKTRHPNLDYRHLILIGHSNGGDISMLLGQQHPGLVSTIISLDNRRVPFPLNKHIKVFSIRSSDQAADPGVLPSAEDARKYGIVIVKVNTKHDDMGGSGTPQQLTELNGYIVNFLAGNAH